MDTIKQQSLEKRKFLCVMIILTQTLVVAVKKGSKMCPEKINCLGKLIIRVGRSYHIVNNFLNKACEELPPDIEVTNLQFFKHFTLIQHGLRLSINLYNGGYEFRVYNVYNRDHGLFDAWCVERLLKFFDALKSRFFTSDDIGKFKNLLFIY